MLKTIAGYLRTRKRLAKIAAKKPLITIRQGGWSTPKPTVSVGFQSRGGLTNAYTYPDNDAGNAAATLSASTLENILGLAVADMRPVITNQASEESPLTRTWKRVPRDLEEAVAA